MDHFRPNKKKKKAECQPAAAIRPKLPPPPPPPPVDVSTEQDQGGDGKDSSSHDVTPQPDTDVGKRRKSKERKWSFSSTDDSKLAHFGKPSSEKKKKKRRSSNSSAKFYVSLDKQQNVNTLTDDKESSQEHKSSDVNSLMDSIVPEAGPQITMETKDQCEVHENSQAPHNIDILNQKKKHRKLPAIPTGDNTTSVPKSPITLTTTKDKDSETMDSEKHNEVVIHGAENQVYLKHVNASKGDETASHPQPPIRRKKKARIITQDIPSNLLLTQTMNNNLTDSSAGSLDSLADANKSQCNDSDNGNKQDSAGKDSPGKPLQNNLPLVPKKPKPEILRAKPKINIHRANINSFTTEDIDICQVRLSAKDKMLMEKGERGSKRRSKSVGVVDVNQVLRKLQKPPVPQKPKFSPKSSSNESLDHPPPKTKPKRKLPVPPKPAHLTALSKGSKEDVNLSSGDEQVESQKHLDDSKTVDFASKSLNTDQSKHVGDESLCEKPVIKIDDSTMGDTQQTVLTESVNTTLEQCASEELASNLTVETSQKTAQLNTSSDECQVLAPKLRPGVLVKVSRKQSAREMKRKQKSFRCRVYEDVDLKDEIMEGEEEDLDFSESDFDGSVSDDSLTDEDGLQFEQEQAEMLGLSPAKQGDTDSQPSSPVPDEPKDRLYQIAKELLETEKAYMSKLKLLDQVFHLRVIVENREHHFMPEGLIPQIFINVKSIYQFHDFLLKQLEERMKEWDSVRKIGDVMMRWAPFLKLYTEYINKFDHAMNTFNMCIEKYPRFASIVEEIQSLPECGMLMLQHHMLEPIQRVPRYELLLRDYLKHLPEDSPDREDTTKALELITKAAEHANETIRKNEHSEKLLSICENLIGASHLNLISPTRQLIKEGSIIKISARDGSHQERYLFLFNDYLLVCVPVTLPKLVKHHYKVKDKLDIEGMRVMEGDDLYTPNTFLVKSKTRSIEFHTPTAEEKDEWQAALWSTIADYTKKQMSRVTGALLTETFEKEELGKRAPTWIKDQAASMCMVCAREFTMFFRRHHCRACGRVICGLCSARKARLDYDGGKYNRVCDNCYNVLELKLDPCEVKSRGQQRRDKTLRGVKASDASLISGYLLMSQNKKNWEKRYFAVRDNFVLYSFKAHEDVFALTSLPLPGYVVAQTKNENQLKGKHVFKLFHIGLKKEYYFQADDKTSLDRWMAVLEKLVRAELPDVEHIITPQPSPTTSPYTVKLTA